MKKIYLSVLLALVSAAAVKAQVFQYLYGNTNTDLLTDGHNTTLGGMNGHFLAGQATNTPFLFTATRTNNAGMAIPAGAPFFSNQYRLSDVPLPPGAPNLRIQEVRSVEINGGNAYGLAGSYVRGNSTNAMGVFYQQLDAMGNPVPLFGPNTTAGYFFNGPASTYSDVHVKKIINSTQVPGDMYILGSLTESVGGYSRIFVLRINQAGALIWSKIYRLDWSSPTNTDIPWDIVESVRMRGTTFEVIVVGEHYQKAGNPSDGFVLRIDYNSGNMINPVQFYGTAAASEGFTCIKTSANGMVDPTGAGYVIGGFVNNGSAAGGMNDFWFVGLTQAGGVSWTNTFDYVNGVGTATNDYCRDLIESNNTAGTFEYYLAGYTDNGVFGSEDMMVIHTDQNGNMMANGQFTYGTADGQRCVRIDQDNTTAAAGGIAMYGTSFHVPQPPPPLGGFDQFLVKAGFNGVTACEYDLRDPKQNPGPGFLGSKSSDNISSFSSYILYSRRLGAMNEFNICSGGCTAPKPPLVAHWNFTGGSLVDGANGLVGNAFGGVTSVPGMLGVPNTAMQFDGTSGYIQVPSSPLMDLQSWTLTALVQPQGFYSGTCQANGIIWRGNQYGANCYSLMFFDNAIDGSCYIYTPTGDVTAGFPAGTYPGLGTDWLGATPCVTNPCINAGQWYCLWLSYDGVTGNLDVYVDGILRVTLNWPNMYGPPVVDDLYIGSSNDAPAGPYPYFFNGIIDDIAIFGGPLVCPLDCKDAENGLAKKMSPVAAKPASGNDIQVVPNPTSGNVELVTSSDWQNGYVEVLNSVGQEVGRKNIDASGRTLIDMSALPSGVYLLRTHGKGQYAVKKVIRN